MNWTEMSVSTGHPDINNSTIDGSNESVVCGGIIVPVLERWTLPQLLAIHRPTIASIDKYLTPLWYTVGFPGNLLAFLVWIQVRMRHSSGCYLAALALADFTFLILQLFFELQQAWGVITLDYPFWCELFPILFLTAQYLSPLLVLGFTFERYISICHPFQREKYCSTKKALMVIAFLVSFTLCLNAVQGYFWTYHGECSVRQTVLENGIRSLWSIWSWVTELLVFGVVPVVILILNILVIMEAKKMSAREEQLLQQSTATARLHKQPGQSATTVTLLAVSFYLIFSTLPVTVCYALIFSFPEGDPCTTDDQLYFDTVWQSHFSYWNVRNVTQEIGMSHYACNFYIYLLTGLAFRRELKLFFLQVFCKNSASRWLRRNSTELTELTTFNKKYVVSNGDK